MSEWLRRWTRNPLGSARRGSNPLAVAFSRTETHMQTQVIRLLRGFLRGFGNAKAQKPRTLARLFCQRIQRVPTVQASKHVPKTTHTRTQNRELVCWVGCLKKTGGKLHLQKGGLQCHEFLMPLFATAGRQSLSCLDLGDRTGPDRTGPTVTKTYSIKMHVSLSDHSEQPVLL